MKETKVYVDELPESCDECKYYTQFTDGIGCVVTQELRPMDECDNYMQASCPLHSIKDHDRELMAKVLEKTKTFVRENTYICGGNATREDIITSSSYNQALRDVLDFLGALQKELEK